MPERTNGIVSKTIVAERSPEVRILLPPHIAVWIIKNMFFKKKKKEPENIEEILASFDDLRNKVKTLEEEVKEMRKRSRSAIQGVGVVRFNPFSDVGGDQSFSLAMLDGNKDGAVITGFYSREGSNVYGKAVKGGNSDYALADEEKKAIAMAAGEETKKKDV